MRLATNLLQEPAAQESWRTVIEHFTQAGEAYEATRT
jgi:hypothetical protein